MKDDGPEPLPSRDADASLRAGKRQLAMTRVEKLDLIWSRTHSDFRGIAGEVRPESLPPAYLGKRIILVLEKGGTNLKLLEHLTDDQIAEKLQVLCRDDGTSAAVEQ